MVAVDCERKLGGKENADVLVVVKRIVKTHISEKLQYPSIEIK